MSHHFKGGIHPPYHKEKTNHAKITHLQAGETVVIPMLQHIGTTCEPLVKVGAQISIGQIIGDSEAFLSAPIHASVSGTVQSIEKYPHPNNTEVLSIVIKNDFKDTKIDELRGLDPDVSSEQIIEKIKQCGIVGMGGAGFPLHIKLNVPTGKQVDTVIINAAECEPYLSSDHRTMMEYPEEILFGIQTILSVCGAKKAIIAIENNKPDAIELFRKKTKDLPSIEVISLPVKYPQGSEKHIIKSVTGRTIKRGKLPVSVGVIVNNVDTCLSVFSAIIYGIPSITRRITLSGNCVRNPGVYQVPVGMLVCDVIEQAGGLIGSPVKIISGGPMMGIAQFNTDIPIIKTSTGILMMDRKEVAFHQEYPCLRCGKCIQVCPMELMPLCIAQCEDKNDTEGAKNLFAADCIECGCCSYACPSKRYLVERIRLAKSKTIALTN